MRLPLNQQLDRNLKAPPSAGSTWRYGRPEEPTNVTCTKYTSPQARELYGLDFAFLMLQLVIYNMSHDEM